MHSDLCVTFEGSQLHVSWPHVEPFIKSVHPNLKKYCSFLHNALSSASHIGSFSLWRSFLCTRMSKPTCNRPLALLQTINAHEWPGTHKSRRMPTWGFGTTLTQPASHKTTKLSCIQVTVKKGTSGFRCFVSRVYLTGQSRNELSIDWLFPADEHPACSGSLFKE